MKPFAGRVAVVTGAGSSLGEAMARTLAWHGAAVARPGRTEAKLVGVRQGNRSDGGEAEHFVCDASDIKQPDMPNEMIVQHSVWILRNIEVNMVF